MSKKKIILVIIIFAFTFFISDVLTYQHDSPADGSDYRGWPIRYYEYFGGECYPGPCSSRGRGFMPIFYILDIIILFIISVIIFYIKTLIFRKKS